MARGNLLQQQWENNAPYEMFVPIFIGIFSLLICNISGYVTVIAILLVNNFIEVLLIPYK